MNKEGRRRYGFPRRFGQWFADRIREYGKANIIVVIVGSAGKDPEAGHMATKKDRPIMFVADPKNEHIRKKNSVFHTHPDNDAGTGQSWREILREYNRGCQRDPSSNTLKLLPAWQLYKPLNRYQNIYQKLVSEFHLRNIFILSEGWGLISAAFLTPDYDITFSKEAAKEKPWALRQGYNCYEDLERMLPKNTDKPVIFLGGKEYVPFFCCLTKDIKSERIVFYNSANEPSAPGCTLHRFDTITNRNWYYECGEKLCEAQKELIESETP